MKVSVIVVCREFSGYLKQCLGEVGKQETTGKPFEVELLFMARDDISPPRMRDQLAKQATGEILAFLDDDAYPSRYWLHYALRLFEKVKAPAITGPAITPDEDSFWQKVSGKSYEWMAGNKKWRYKEDDAQWVDDAPSCNLLIKKCVFEEVGGFDTDDFPGEDTYLCEKLTRAGYRVFYDPRVAVFHHRRGLGEHLKQIGRYGMQRGKYFRKYPATSRKLEYLIPSVAVVLLMASIIVYGVQFLRGLLK